MRAIMYEKLFEPYTIQGQHIEGMLKFLLGLAKQRNITPDVVEMAVNEIFAEVAGGRKFSTTKCSCGCGIDKASTDITHAIRDRMYAIDKSRTAAVKDIMQDRYRVFLAGEMKRLSKFEKQQAKLIKGTLWERLTDWSTSRVYCLWKKQNVKANMARARLNRIKKYGGR